MKVLDSPDAAPMDNALVSFPTVFKTLHRHSIPTGFGMLLVSSLEEPSDDYDLVVRVKIISNLLKESFVATFLL